MLMRLCKNDGNKQILRSVLDNIKNNKLLDDTDNDGKCCLDYEKLEMLLLKNVDNVSMDNCLMILFENGYKELLVKMMKYLDDNDYGTVRLKLLAKKNYANKGQTMLMRISYL